MKVLPIVNTVRKDMVATQYRVQKASKEGYKVAERAAEIYKQGRLKRYINITRSVSGRIAKGTTVKEVPYIAGAVGLLIPVPLASPVLMGLGFVARFVVSGVQNVQQKLDKSNKTNKKSKFDNGITA